MMWVAAIYVPVAVLWFVLAALAGVEKDSAIFHAMVWPGVVLVGALMLAAVVVFAPPMWLVNRAYAALRPPSPRWYP